MNKHVAWLCAPLAIISVATTSCTGTSGDGNETEISLITSDIPINSVIDSITYIPIGENNGLFIGRCGAVRLCNGMIYMPDQYFSPKRILAYDSSDGSPRFAIDKLGQGPDEYIQILDYAVDSEYVYILDSFRDCLSLYDSHTGDFVRHIKMPFRARSVEPLDNGRFLFTVSPSDPEERRDTTGMKEYRLVVTDSDMNITASYLEVKEEDGKSPIGVYPELVRNQGNITYTNPVITGFYSLDSSSGEEPKFYPIHMDNSLAGHNDVTIEELNNYQYLSRVPYECDGYIYMSYSNGEISTDGLWDKKHGQLMTVNSDEYPYQFVRFEVVGADGNNLIAYANDYDRYLDAVEKGHKRAPEEIERKFEEAGGALVIYHLR